MIFRQKQINHRSDEQLMTAIGNGHSAAFSVLYERYHRRLFYFFYRMLGEDRELANDFLHDLFLKIINKPELYNKEHRFAGWIYSIAHNMCKNEYRKREQRKTSVPDPDPDVYTEEPFHDERFEKEILIAEMYRQLDLLDESQRSVLILKYRENFSLKEIAGILELPEGTVKSRLHYARLELSKRLKANKGIKGERYE